MKCVNSLTFVWSLFGFCGDLDKMLITVDESLRKQMSVPVSCATTRVSVYKKTIIGTVKHRKCSGSARQLPQQQAHVV